MTKESSMSIISMVIGFVVVFLNVSKSMLNKYLYIMLLVGFILGLISLMLSIHNKIKIRSKRNKYIFAIILSSIALGFNSILLISTMLFDFVL